MVEMELEEKDREHETPDQTLGLFLEELYLTMKDNLAFKKQKNLLERKQNSFHKTSASIDSTIERKSR
jgi:hypothetical protein